MTIKVSPLFLAPGTRQFESGMQRLEKLLYQFRTAQRPVRNSKELDYLDRYSYKGNFFFFFCIKNKMMKNDERRGEIRKERKREKEKRMKK